MSGSRPDPDRLLDRVQREERASGRGRLKVFLGAVAGVGKTYQMLEQARARRQEGVDVVVGWVDTHGRVETSRLLAGLEILPRRRIRYRDADLEEFDLDAALQRRPQILLVDELAHTNAPGSRHTRRWRDVEELLAAGIDVHTTVNIQHLECLNDVVAQITGVTVHERLPDTVVEQADEVELVDLPPGELLERLRQGKVYIPEQAARALRGFFTQENLVALRELALRHMADRVDSQVRLYKEDRGITAVLPVKERIVVCVSASPAARRVVRTARRMAQGLRADWIVAYVEPAGRLPLSEKDREAVASTLTLAEQLGAQTTVLHGPSVAEEILSYARRQNATKILVGKPMHPWWRYRLLGSVLDQLVRGSGEIDIYVISGRGEEDIEVRLPSLRPSSPARNYLAAILVTAAATGLTALLSRRVEATNLIMVYLAGVVLTAARFGRGPSILASILSVAAFDFLFVPPFLTFAVRDAQYLMVLAITLAVGLFISSLVTRVRQHAELAREREARMAVLYRASREFSRADSVEQVVVLAEEKLSELLGAEVWVLLRNEAGQLAGGPGVTSRFPLSEREYGVARWVFEHGRPAGLGTETLPAAGALYLPLTGAGGALGVLGIFAPQDEVGSQSERMRLLEAVASQLSSVAERCLLAREARRAQLRLEREKLHSTVLSSVSHDLRTPLAAIAGAASGLLDGERLEEPVRRELAQAIADEAERLNRLVGNLLSLSRLEAGALHLQKEWHPLEEVLGSALTYLEKRLQGRDLELSLPPDLPMVDVDDVLIEQVFVNLLDNALKYTPAGTALEIQAGSRDGGVEVLVADRGPGISPGGEERIFDKFDRGAAPNRGGVGLGLTICRGIVEAHGGHIRAENRAGGGVVFAFTLPSVAPPREVEE